MDNFKGLTGNSWNQFKGSKHSHSSQRPQVKVWAHRGQDSRQAHKNHSTQSAWWHLLLTEQKSHTPLFWKMIFRATFQMLEPEVRKGDDSSVSSLVFSVSSIHSFILYQRSRLTPGIQTNASLIFQWLQQYHTVRTKGQEEEGFSAFTVSVHVYFLSTTLCFKRFLKRKNVTGESFYPLKIRAHWRSRKPVEFKFPLSYVKEQLLHAVMGRSMCTCVCVCVSVQHKEPIPRSHGLQLSRAVSVTGLGSAELIRPLGPALRHHFLLLLLLDSLHRRAKEEKVRLKVSSTPPHPTPPHPTTSSLLANRPPPVSCWLH